MANADPYVVAPEVTLGWNRYAYVFDDPLSMTDPSGFAPEADAGSSTMEWDDMGESEGGYWQLGQEPDRLDFGINTTMPIVVTGSPPEAGAATDAGPATDDRGSTDQPDNTTRDVGLGLADGAGNTGYMVGTGALVMLGGPVIGGLGGLAAVANYWRSGGNPAGAGRRFLGELIGDETLAADPSSGVYLASLITGEMVSGGIAGLARGTGVGLRAAATEAAASCAHSCGPAAGGFGARLVGVISRAGCFVAGTPVAMADGSQVAIEAIEAGQTVACVDELGPAICTVGETFQRRVSTVLDLEIETDEGERSTITVTPDHPFFVAQFERYLDADDLEPGYTLALLDGRAARVEGYVRRTGSFEVYNFEARGAHDYFAGPVFVLVHNGCSRKLARAIKAATGVERPANHATHHIVAGGAQRAEPARRILAKFGINVDDAVNGVYLPNGKAAAAGGKAANHQGLHTSSYYRSVNERLAGAQTREQVEQTLSDIAGELAAGTFRP